MICIQKFILKEDGTANSRCLCKHPELIENYDKAIADNTQTWQCHHRLETHNSDGERRLVDISSSELIALGMYYDRPPEELVFLTELEHKRLHNVGKHSTFKGKPGIMKGKHHTEEAKRKMSEAHKGKPGSWKGKHLSEEHKRKISEAQKGKYVSEETRKKISEVRKGRYHNHTEETRKKMSEARKGMFHWFNNSTVNVRAKDCPEGFVPGRLRK